MRKRPGQQFEEAVHSFVAALGPGAEVKFDHHPLDRDTGKPRQVDVWVTTQLFGHFPLAIHISCKDYKRPVNVTQMGSFINDVQSTSASSGIIYSASGFTKNAIAKASKNGIACCRLYRNQPADKPQTLIFPNSYLFRPTISLVLRNSEVVKRMFTTWNELFDVVVSIDPSRQTLLDALCELFSRLERAAFEGWKDPSKPPDHYHGDLDISAEETPSPLHFGMQVGLIWKAHVARLQANLLNGSYCLTNNSFLGTQSGPSIDLESAHPGDGWSQLDEIPDKLASPSVVIILKQPNVSETLRLGLGSQNLPDK